MQAGGLTAEAPGSPLQLFTPHIFYQLSCQYRWRRCQLTWHPQLRSAEANMKKKKKKKLKERPVRKTNQTVSNFGKVSLRLNLFTHTLTNVSGETRSWSIFGVDRWAECVSVRKWPTAGCLLRLPRSSFDPSQSVFFICVHARVCVCVYSRRSIPGLKLVPARSPNGSIDHCSVPFSNQRTAVVASSTQENYSL